MNSKRKVDKTHYKLVEKYLQETEIFERDEILFLSKHFIPKKIKKNEYLIKEGENCDQFIFVVKGIFRSYFTINGGSKISSKFIFENDLTTAYASYIKNEPSEENIQAVINSEVLILKYEDSRIFEQTSKNWVKFLKRFSDEQFLEKEKTIKRIYNENAETGYLNLIEKKPHYFQNIPLNYIASYLGITQRHLSKIRKGIMIKEIGTYNQYKNLTSFG